MTNQDTFANSWSSYYSTLANAQRDDAELLAKYVAIIPHAATSAVVTKNLASVPDCVGMIATTGGRIRFLHHFHHDESTPVLTGTNELWALLGIHDAPSVVSVNHAQLGVRIPTTTVPSYTDLRDAATASAYRGKIADDGEEAPRLNSKYILVIPPVLAWSLVTADTDDPAKLGLIAARVIHEGDRWLATDAGNGAHPDHVDQGPTSDALFNVLAFLWRAAQDEYETFPNPITIEPLPVGPSGSWARSVRDRHITPEEAPTPGGIPHDREAIMNLTETTANLAITIARNHAAQETGTADGSKNFKKFPLSTRTMILRASSKDAAGYCDPQGILIRTAPVATYMDILAATSSAQAHTVISHILNNVHKLSVIVPASLAAAIYAGHIKWGTRFQSGAFSMFALPPASAIGHNFRAEEARTQQALEATEGKGISSAQADATAKITHTAITDLHNLQDFIHNKCYVNVLVFGDLSPLVTRLQGWSSHIREHREAYELLSSADITFCTQIGQLWDMSEQAYLQDCMSNDKATAIDVTILDHTDTQRQIAMGIGPCITLPANLAAQLSTPQRKNGRTKVVTPDQSDDSDNNPPPKKKSRKEKRISDRRNDTTSESPCTRTVPTQWSADIKDGNVYYALVKMIPDLATKLSFTNGSICGGLLLRGKCRTPDICRHHKSHDYLVNLDKNDTKITSKWFKKSLKSIE